MMQWCIVKARAATNALFCVGEAFGTRSLSRADDETWA